MRNGPSGSMRLTVAMTLILLAVTVAGTARAAEPLNVVNYQGVLRDGGGQPLTGQFDMVFRFFNDQDPVIGQEMLVDVHDAVNGIPVTVTGGLFNVGLGSGVVSDGTGPGTYNFLDEVFRDLSEVWLEVQVGTETLTPRILILSAPAALNSSHLSGLTPDQLLRSDTSDQFTSGTLTMGSSTTLNVNGLVGIDTATPSTKLQIVDGSISLEGAMGTWGGIWFKTQHLGNSSNHHMIVRGEENALLPESLSIHHRNATPTDDPGFTERVFRVQWDGSTMIGETSAALASPPAGGALVVDGEIRAGGPLWIGNVGGSAAYNNLVDVSGSDVGLVLASTADLRVEDDLRVDGFLGGNGNIVVDASGPDGNQNLYFYENGSFSESLTWSDTFNRFEITDDVVVQGNLSATGAKPFVQNHPQRPDLSVVYAALEGDEVGTYTRGSARLEEGVARVRLGETFAWVTNPNNGLTAHVTPRGEGALLFVESVTPHVLVVRASDGSPLDAAFDYVVHGLRIGFEDWNVVRPRTVAASVPVAAHCDRQVAGEPALAAYRASGRFLAMRPRAARSPEVDFSASLALRQAIGEYDPDAPSVPLVPVAGSDAPAVPGELVAQPVAGEAGAPPQVPGGGRAAAPGGAPRTGIGKSVAETGTGWDPAGVLYARSVRPSATELASYFPVSELVEVGDVLVMDPGDPGHLRRGSVAGDPAVFGIVSGEPGLALGGGIARIEAADADLGNRLAAAREGGDREVEASLWAELERRFEQAHAPVALSGVVLCKVDASYGPIRVGALLTVSPNPGHAMRSSDHGPGTILGKAMQGLDEGTGIIRVLVMLR